MKHIQKPEKKRRFNRIYRLSILFLPIIIGIALISFEVAYETITINDKQSHEISDYETHVKARIKEEVEKAIYIADYYYANHRGVISDEQIEKEIVSLLENLKSSDVGYFFAADFNGNNMLGPSKGGNVYNIEDKNGLKVVQALISEAKKGGGYVQYVMPPLEGVEQVPKISYVMPFKPFSWYIGAGVNLSEIDIIKEQIRAEVFQKNTQTIVVTSVLIILFMLLFSRINSRMYRKIESEIGLIKEFLEKSATEHAVLDTDSLQYAEFEQIGKYTVSMVEKRNNDQAVLTSQFELIKETAEKLERTNQSLAKEITEHAKALKLLRESQQRFKSIVNTLPDVIFIMDQDGMFLDCEADQKIWPQMKKEDYIGKNIYETFPKEIADPCVGKIKEALKTNTMQTYEFQVNNGESDDYYEVRMITFQENQVFTIVRNVTETKKAQLTNEYLSYHDQLTGAYNRRYFEEALIHFDNDGYLPIAIAMVDVNGLKLTNDAFGHQTGDKLLRLVADILCRHCSSPKGFIARIGGDEFAIVCPNTDHNEMDEMIKNIYKSINSERKKHSILSISIGWEIKTSAEQTMTDIFNKAEQLMYNKKLTESQSIRNQTVQAIMKTLNEKNVREKIHSERVSTISRLIGEAMNLDYGAVKELETAGLLHDIGKIAVDENILNKERRLTDDEYNKIKKHPESSYQILKSINAYASLAEDVLSHHERWDGNGYPRRLKGEEISLIARIICVADAYEAMTADRAYRAAMTKEEALKELKKNAGTQFDKKIVKIFEEKVCKKL